MCAQFGPRQPNTTLVAGMAGFAMLQMILSQMATSKCMSVSAFKPQFGNEIMDIGAVKPVDKFDRAAVVEKCGALYFQHGGPFGEFELFGVQHVYIDRGDPRRAAAC